MINLLINQIDSPIGTILTVVDRNCLCALDFADYESRMMKLLQKRYGQFHLLAGTSSPDINQNIQAYFTGNYHSLDTIPVRLGGTPFQQKVWATLRTIPSGTVISYSELATKIGKSTAYRAVGMANSQNPIAIILPCHRVIGANATLTGYAGGLYRKRWLLQHEGVDLSQLN